MKLSVVLPCYHPQEGWEQQVLTTCAELEKRIGAAFELILTDDGNNDPLITAAISRIKEGLPSFQLVSYLQNQGKGYALRKGIAAAGGELIVYTDVDFPYDTDSFMAIYNSLAMNEADIAAGIKDTSYESQLPFMRRLISRKLRQLIRLFLKMPITDTQCGLKGFNQSVKPVFLETRVNRYLFDLEFLYRCHRSYPEKRVVSIPVKLRPGVVFRKMSYRILIPEMVNFLRILMS